MNSSAKVQKEVAASVGDQPICVETPFVRKHGLSQEDVTHIKQDLVIFLSLRGDGAHYRDARAWNHIKMTKLPAPAFWYFQLLLLMAERSKEGSLRPRHDRFSNPKGYVDCVDLAARVLGGDTTKPEDAKAMVNKLTSDNYIDLRFLHEVEVRKKTLGGDGRAPKVTRRDQAGARRNRGQPPAEDVPMPVPAPIDPARVAPPSTGGPVWARQFSVFLNGRANQEKQGVDTVDPDWDNVFAPTRHPSAEAGAAAAAAPDVPFTGPEWVPKYDFSVTPVPDIQGQVIGLMVRFMIHDPAIDPMAFFDRLVNNAHDRMSHQLNGGGGGGGRGGKSNLFSREMFPNYTGLFYSQHPVSNNTSYETYLDCAIRLCPDVLEGTTRAELTGKLKLFLSSPTNNPLHISRLLTMQRALAQAVKAGADPIALGQLASWTSGNGVARFPLPTYRYRPEQLFWKHHPMIGFMEQFFPHVDGGDEVTAAILAGRGLDRWNADGTVKEDYVENDEELELEMRSAYDQLRLIIQDSTLIDRNLVLVNRLVPYDTPNAYVHRAAEAERVLKIVEQQRPTHYEQTQQDILKVRDDMRQGDHWRTALMTRENEVELFLSSQLFGNPDAKRITMLRRGLPLLKRVQECEEFIRVMDLTRQSRLKVFSNLWLVEGEVDDLPVPESLRAMMRWFRDRRNGVKGVRVPHLTRQFMMFDPELGIFGNSMLRQIKMFTCVGLILQPIICMLTEGLFSCFRYSPKKLAFNLLFHGRFDTGKSYAAINILMKLICIDGTVLPYVTQTKAADSTMRHYYDLIIASDEVPQRKVSQVEAEKDPDATNKDKLKMTDRSLGVNVFTYETDPNGNQVRWARTFRTDHFVALVEVTNHVVEATSALASRYFRMTVAQPRQEARKFQNDAFMSRMLESDVVGYLNTNQYLSAAIYKAIQVGVMREPHMGLFMDMSNCIIDYLQSVNAISKDTGARGLEIMIPYAIQMVIHNAIHCAFDLPGAPNYMKDFVPEMIKEVEPFLYCTVDIVWWCWTTLASGWIEEMSCNVIESAVRCCGLDEWGSSAENMTPYEMYELDINDRIPWRRRRNEKAEKDPLIDLQYITFYGNKEQVARQIASKSNPQLDWTDVISVFNSLAGKLVPVPWDVYRPMPLSDMKAWHQFKQLPQEVPAGHAQDGRELRDLRPGLKSIPLPHQKFPMEFCISNSDPALQRTVLDMPRVGPNQRLPAVDMSDAGRGMIHIAPWVGEYFRSERVIEALEYATVCAGTPAPHKTLTGMHLPNDQQNFQVICRTPESLEGSIIDLDAAAGWGPDGKTRLPGFSAKNPRPSRREGISFDRPAALSKADAVFFNSVSAAPTNMSMEEWCSKSEADTALMGQIRYTHRDLDFASALTQHCRSGQPLDAPIKTPRWIEEEYKKGCATEGRPWTKGINYPCEVIEENEARRQQWADLESVRAISKAMPSLAKWRNLAAQSKKRPSPSAAPAAAAAAINPEINHRKLARPTITNEQQAFLKDIE